MNQNEKFSIRQMIELTGLSEFTIRGWENRYQAFSPDRSDTGRREYTKKDIAKALLIRELLKRDQKISKIAGLNIQKLQALFESLESSSPVAKIEHKDKAIAGVLELIALQKWSELAALIKTVNYKSSSELIHLFFLPLLKDLTSRVNAGFVSIAQEHVLSALLKEKIYSRLTSLDSKKKTVATSNKVRFILATPEGDYHEIGLLLAHLLIKSYGFTSLFLGPHTPSQDLAETALRFEASHLLIVSTVSKKEGARQHLLNFVSDIHKKIGPEIRILLAGSQAPHLPRDKNSTLINVGSFIEFENYLSTLATKS